MRASRRAGVAIWLLAGLAGCDGGKESQPGDTQPGDDTGTTSAEVWPHCPGAEAWVGDAAWVGWIEVTGGALYCSLPSEDRTLQEELAAKAQLRLIAGGWAAPGSAGSYPFSLPLCTLTPGGENPGLDGAGQTTAAPSSFGGVTYTWLEGTQPMVDASGAAWALDHRIILAGPEGSVPDPLVLDGREADASAGSGAELTLYRAGGSAQDRDAVVFGPCGDPGWQVDTHAVTFEGGEIALELALGDDVVITAPSALLRASGELDGEAFEVEEVFRLVYRPGHHHLTRDFAVLFEAPIGEACGLLIEGVDAQQGTTTAQVHLADCGLAPLGERAVSAESWAEGG